MPAARHLVGAHRQGRRRRPRRAARRCWCRPSSTARSRRKSDSSPASGASSRGNLQTASRAMRATVSLSSDMPLAPKRLNGAVGSGFGPDLATTCRWLDADKALGRRLAPRFRRSGGGPASIIARDRRAPVEQARNPCATASSTRFFSGYLLQFRKLYKNKNTLRPVYYNCTRVWVVG